MKKYKMYVLRNDQRLQFNDDSILRNECQARATRVRHECYTNLTSATRTIWVWYEWKFLIFITTWVKTYFYTPSLEERFHFKSCNLEMPHSHAKILLKSAPQKLNFVMQKLYQKVCSCQCPCTFPHSCI